MVSVKKLKITQIFNWRLTDWDGKFDEIPSNNIKVTELLGVKLADGSYLIEDGQVLKERLTLRIEAKQTRNVPDKVKQEFDRSVKLHNEIQKAQREMDAAKEKLSRLRADFYDMKNRMQTAKGLLTVEEFIGAFFENLKPSLKREITAKKYTVCASSSFGGAVTNIEIIREAMIEKYFRKASFLYTEYDGTVNLRSDSKKDPNYQRILKAHADYLYVKSDYKPNDYLYLGDKDWLIYHCTYSIPVKKPLTPEYAKELAEKFC